MDSPAEAKPQGWRAVALFEDGGERLLYLGRSATQVRAGFAAAFAEVLDAEERARVRSISLERWYGTPDAGCWLHQTALALPSTAKMTPSA
jgi:hypothetical protein